MKKRVTRHGMQRMTERGNITHEKDAQKNALRARENGIRYGETSGELKKWLDGRYFQHKKKVEFRIYGGYLYIFGSNGKVITFFEIPGAMNENIKEYVAEDVYARYISYQEKKEQGKSAQRELKNLQKKNKRRMDFLSLVMISDIEEAFPHLPAKIKQIHLSPKGASVLYVPHHNERPNLDVITDYIKTYYNIRSVYLKHMRDKNGKLIFGQDDDPYEAELVYSSEVSRGALQTMDWIKTFREELS